MTVTHRTVETPPNTRRSTLRIAEMPQNETVVSNVEPGLFKAMAMYFVGMTVVATVALAPSLLLSGAKWFGWISR